MRLIPQDLTIVGAACFAIGDLVADGLNVWCRGNLASAPDRKRSILERVGVGRGVGLRAKPCQIMRRYCCIIGVWAEIVLVFWFRGGQ